LGLGLKEYNNVSFTTRAVSFVLLELVINMKFALVKVSISHVLSLQIVLVVLSADSISRVMFLQIVLVNVLSLKIVLMSC